MKFTLGSANNVPVSIDIQSLLRTRLLVQANSGGGKSYLLRRILEQSHGMVQQVIIDLEGEFSTLREKYDYILVGRGGEVHPDPRYAKEIAEKILELGVSAIIDLFDLKQHDRIRFVRLLLEAMINVRKELWRPCLVVVDEAHQFCPEGKDSEASSAVIDLCTRGRKRSFAAVLATQRLAKLHKDAAAECLNKLMGRTTLDIDRKRAGEEIGFADKQQILGIRDLEPGEFYVYGPSISKVVQKVKIGGVLTTHPDIGHKAPPPPPPRERVRRVLEQLANLPKEAEEKQATEKDLRGQIAHLERQLKLGKSIGRKLEIPQEIIDVQVERALVKHRIQVEKATREWKVWAKRAGQLIRTATMSLGMIEAPPELMAAPNPKITPAPAPPVERIRSKPDRILVDASQNGELDSGGQRILDTIATLNLRGIEPRRDTVARWMAIHPNGSRYLTTIATLRRDGYLEAQGMKLTPHGEQCASPGATGVEAAFDAITEGAMKRVFQTIRDAERPLSREELAERLEIHPNGSRLLTNLAWLRVMGLIPERGKIELTEGARA